MSVIQGPMFRRGRSDRRHGAWAPIARLWGRGDAPDDTPRARSRRAALSALELLEERQLMAVTPSLFNGVLRIDGSSKDDVVYIDSFQPAAGVSQIRVIGGTIGQASSQWIYNRDAVQSIQVNGLGGDDTINAYWLGYSIPVGGDGGDGHDTLLGGVGNDYLIGGRGNDRLDGGPAGTNVLDGGRDDDTYAFGFSQVGAATILEADQEGTDTIDFTGYTSAITLNLDYMGYTSSGSLQIFPAIGRIENVVGSSFDDRIWGNSLANRIDGGGGHDMIWGTVGNDTLLGGSGDDYLFGEAGTDTLDAGVGTDILNGGENADRYVLGAGAAGLKEINEAIDNGFDTLDFSARTDPVRVDLSYPDIQQAAAGLSLRVQIGGGQAGAPDQAIENIIGGSGNDVLIGNGSANRLVGGAGNDTLVGKAGDDTYVITLNGSVQDDSIVELAGDSGVDTIDISTSAGGYAATIDLNRTGWQSLSGAHRLNLNLVAIENAIGSAGNDTIYGNALNNRIDGGSGNDRIEGLAGDDVLIGQAGNDTIVGREGNDWLAGGLGDDTYVFPAAGQLGADRVTEHEGEGADTLDFSSWAAADPLALDLTLSTLQVAGARQSLTLPGHSIENVSGGAGNDRINAGGGPNRLEGRGGNDTLAAGDGPDVLEGGAGNDSLDGGLGDDTYLFDADLVDIGVDQIVEASGGGTDAVDFSQTSRPIQVDLTRTRWSNGPHSLTVPAAGRIENVVGGTGSDYLLGDDFANLLAGGAGDDSINARGGDDTVSGGDGRDKLSGGSGNDIVVGDDGHDSVFGDIGDDVLEGGAGNDTVDGGDGHDTLTGGLGDDWMAGGRGDDAFRYEVAPGAGLGSDTITDSAGTDTLDFTGSTVSGAGVVLYRTTTQTYGGAGTLSYRLNEVSIENFKGGYGDETVIGNSLANRLSGGEGNDYLWGDAGDDALEGGPGRDTLSGNAGNDIFFSDSQDTIEPDSTSRKFVTGSHRFTHSELSHVDPRQQSGAYSGLYAELSGNVLSLLGPSGYGFKMTSSWTRSGSSATGEVFTSSRSVTISSSYHGLQIPLSLPAGISFRTLADTTDNLGDVASNGITMGIVSLNFDSTDSASPFALFSDLMGLDFDLPSLGGTGTAMGLKLGQELIDDSQGRFDDVPLNPAVPYLYFTASVGLSASIGGLDDVSVSGVPNASVVVVIDPADPMVYLHADGIPGPVPTIGFAGSNNGYIPFVPEQMPNVPTDPIYGNFYALATVDLSPKLPISITGSVVVDLDANDDGTLANVTGDNIARFFRGEMSSEEIARTNPLGDVRFGLNGTADLTFEKSGFDLSLPVGSFSMMYQPGMISFRGEMEDPFANTPLRSFLVESGAAMAPTYDIDGHIDWEPGGVDSWHVTVGASNLPIAAGFRASRLELSLSNEGVEAYARIDSIGGIGQAELHGAIYANGDFSLRAYASLDLDAKIARVYFNTSFVFERYGSSVKFYADMNAGLRLGTDSFNISLDVSASISFQAIGGSVRFVGQGEARGSVQLGLIRASVSLGGFYIDNDGFTLMLPVVPDIHISW